MQASAERDTINVNSRAEWRAWLEENHLAKQSIWLVCNTKKSHLPTIPWGELVEEALCFGWIDSTRKKIDALSFKQIFSKRKPNSTWSKVNKEKVQKLIADGLMTQSGLDSIDTAKRNGSWSILDEVEEMIIPIDLKKAFENHIGSKDYFLSLSKSTRKMMLQWIVMAKRPETRQKRIDEIAEHAGQKKKPQQF